MYSNIKNKSKAERAYYSRPGKCRRCSQLPAEGKKFCQKHLDYAKKMHAGLSAAEIENLRDKARKRIAEIREEALAHYGGKCVCCSEEQKEFLTFDHIQGDGAEIRRLEGRGQQPRKLKAAGFPGNVRVLCHNCNSAIGIYGMCPHGNLEPQATNHPANRKARGLPAFELK